MRQQGRNNDIFGYLRRDFIVEGKESGDVFRKLLASTRKFGRIEAISRILCDNFQHGNHLKIKRVEIWNDCHMKGVRAPPLDYYWSEIANAPDPSFWEDRDLWLDGCFEQLIDLMLET